MILFNLNRNHPLKSPPMPTTELSYVGALNLSIDDLKYDDEIYFCYTCKASFWREERGGKKYLIQFPCSNMIKTFQSCIFLLLIYFHKHTTMETRKIVKERKALSFAKHLKTWKLFNLWTIFLTFLTPWGNCETNYLSRDFDTHLMGILRDWKFGKFEFEYVWGWEKFFS